MLDKDMTAWAAGVRDAPRQAYQDVRKARFDVERARTTAEGVTGIRYDTDKVQGGAPRDMAINVATLIDAEEALVAAKNRYNCTVLSFKYVIDRAVALRVFDKTQAKLWMDYYSHGYGRVSLKKLANKYGLTKRRVQYLLRDKQAVRAFHSAVESVVYDIDWSELETYIGSVINEEMTNAATFEREQKTALY